MVKNYKYYQYVMFLPAFPKINKTIKIVSNTPITEEIVEKLLVREYKYDGWEDSFEFINKPETVIL